MKTLYLLILPFLYFACSTPSDDSDKVNFADSSSHELLTKDSLSKYRLDNIKVGDSINDLESKLNEYKIILDSLPEQEFENKSFDYFYNIFDKNDELLAKLHLDTLKIKIIILEIISEKLLVDENIRIGSNLKDIKLKYNISDVYFDYDIGLIVSSDDFGGGFGLDFEKINDINFNFEDPDIDLLPDQLEVNKIYINKRR